MSTATTSEGLMSCSGCGATVYPEHLDRHMAGYWSGKLYCSYCLVEKQGGGAAPPQPPPIPDELTSFPLEEAESVPETAKAPAITAPPPPLAAAPTIHRPPRTGSSGATRMRIFHARLSDGAVSHLDQQINDWLDQNPEIEIKFSNSTVGTWEGKHPEPNLILTLFY